MKVPNLISPTYGLSSMVQALQQMSQEGIEVMSCSHNDTGTDSTMAAWQEHMPRCLGRFTPQAAFAYRQLPHLYRDVSEPPEVHLCLPICSSAGAALIAICLIAEMSAGDNNLQQNGVNRRWQDRGQPVWLQNEQSSSQLRWRHSGSRPEGGGDCCRTHTPWSSESPSPLHIAGVAACNDITLLHKRRDLFSW